MTTLVVIGDSVAQGFAADDHATQNFGVLMAARLGWSFVNDGLASTGFLYTDGTLTYLDRLADNVVAYDPDVVLVQGSSNDLPGYAGAGWTAAEVAAAAAALYAEIHTALPDARIIATPPLFKVRSGAGYTAIADSIYTDLIAAMKAAIVYPIKVTWIDPITADWVNDDNYGVYLASGPIHPTTAGHAYLAARLAFAISPPATGLDF